MEREQALKIIETLLYMTDHPLSEKEIVEILEIKAFDEEAVRMMVTEISDRLIANNAPLQVVEVAGGIQMASKQEMAPWIRKLYKERLTVRLSPSALETLSIIAYKQPIAKADVELIRGVEASGVMDTLVERRLVKVVGRKETIGRPLLYGTTSEFLRQFGLKHLMDLPDVSTLPAAAPSTQQQEFLNLSGAAVPEAEATATESVDEVGASETAVSEPSAVAVAERAPEENALPAENNSETNPENA